MKNKKELIWILRIGWWYSIRSYFEYWWGMIVIRGILKRKWFCVMPPFKITFRTRVKWKELTELHRYGYYDNCTKETLAIVATNMKDVKKLVFDLDEKKDIPDKNKD